MSDANFASLTPTLLARKGGAKPAMRPQSGIPGPIDGKEAAANLEDLGWNDMGDDTPAEKVVAIAPRAANESGAHVAPNQVRESLTRIAAKLDQPVAQPPRRPVWQGQRRRRDRISGQEHIDRVRRSLRPKLRRDGFQARGPAREIRGKARGLNRGGSDRAMAS